MNDKCENTDNFSKIHVYIYIHTVNTFKPYY